VSSGVVVKTIVSQIRYGIIDNRSLESILTNLRIYAGQVPPLNETNGRLYINFEDFVQEKAEETDSGLF